MALFGITLVVFLFKKKKNIQRDGGRSFSYACWLLISTTIGQLWYAMELLTVYDIVLQISTAASGIINLYLYWRYIDERNLNNESIDETTDDGLQNRQL